MLGKTKVKEFSTTALAKIIKAHPEPDVLNGTSFAGVSIDSRTTQAGDCFFAIRGENFDGHDYISDAFAKGAACAVVSKDFKDDKFKNKVLLRVNDTIKALGDFAMNHRQQGGFRVIAITGSVGKTMTRHIVYHILSQHFHCYQAPKNFNNNIGLPLTLLGAPPETKIIIAELGSNYPGEIAYLTQIAAPDIAVVTNVYPAHLAGFGCLETIIQEKLSISKGLQPEGVLIINGDSDRLVSTCRSKDMQFMAFGKSDTCNIQAHNITYNPFGSEFTIDDAKITLPLLGSGSVENALAAWAVCSRFEMTINDFAEDVKTLPPVPMRAELLQIGTLVVLNDCYNANPASMKNALDILSGFGTDKNRRLVFVCGDMAELGQQTQNLHTQLGECIAGTKVQLLLAVGKFAKLAAETAKQTAEYGLQTECFDDVDSACNNLQKFVKDYDIILVKGSRVAKLEIVVQKLKELFS